MSHDVQDPAPDTYLTTSEVGRLLGVSQRTVNYWVERGVLHSWRTAGGHCRVSRQSVELLLQKRQQELKRETGWSPTLLLVEDDPELTEIFREVVAGWPFEVHLVTAENGYEGLIQAGFHKPDLIVSDLAMPSMDGCAMIRSLCAYPELGAARIVVVTALNAEEIAAHGGVPEGVPVYAKPAPFKKLREMVERLIREQEEKSCPTTIRNNRRELRT